MNVAFETDASEDLRPLVARLRQLRVPHRIWEEGGRVRLGVPDARLVPLVEEAVRALRSGQLDSAPRWPAGAAPTSAGAARPLADAVLRSARAHPGTFGLVLLALLFFPATALDLPAVEAFRLRWLMIVPIERVGDFISFPPLSVALGSGEIWRLWTPALVHFGAVHLAFDVLWLWEFGRRIEAGAGTGRLLEAVLVLAPASNLAQYLLDEGPNFGGLSGVVYGLLGWLLVAGRRSPHPAFRLPAALVVMLVLMLVFFSTGATEAFGLYVANGAHWGGFVAGMLWAMLRVRDERPRASDDAGSGAAP